MLSQIKAEPVMAVEDNIKTAVVIVNKEDIKVEALHCIAQFPDGIALENLSVLLCQFSQEQMQVVINDLLSEGTVIMVKGSNQGKEILKLKINSRKRVARLTEEEQTVYDLIKDSKNKGIRKSELLSNAGLPVTQIRKILQRLKKDEYIKAITVGNARNPYYVLFDFEADSSLTGGAFYSNQEIDTELIYRLTRIIIKFLQDIRKQAMRIYSDNFELKIEQSFVNPQEITNYVARTGAVTVSLSVDDIERILELAVLDGTVERRADGKVRAIAVQQFVSPLVCMPCGICPLINDCKPGHVISPESCRYMSEWHF